MAVGTPYNGDEVSPTDSVASSACLRAMSPVTVTKAPTASDHSSTRCR